MTVHRFDTDGGELVVEVEGQGPLVVCAPGLGDTRDAFAPLANQLVAQGYTAARMDVRGHGDSSANFSRYGDEATADDFLLVAKKLSNGPAIFAGDSFSAGAATIAAGKEPGQVSGIILLAPFLRNPAGPTLMAITQTLFWRPWGPMMWKMYSKTLWPGLGDKASERAARSTELLTRPGRWAAFQATLAGADHSVVGPWISKVKAPVLVIMGDKDPDWSKPLEEAKWVESNFTDAESVIVPGAGHAPMLESPAVVGESVLKYLNRLKAQGSL